MYSLDVDGAGGRAPFPVYRAMGADGGGWTHGAIVGTTTSSDNRTRGAGVTAFGVAVPGVLDDGDSVDLTGARFSSVRIDAFTLGRNVQRSAPTATTGDGTTYRSGGGVQREAHRADERPHRVGVRHQPFQGV